jgi:hypothetical protein
VFQSFPNQIANRRTCTHATRVALKGRKKFQRSHWSAAGHVVGSRTNQKQGRWIFISFEILFAWPTFCSFFFDWSVLIGRESRDPAAANQEGGGADVPQDSNILVRVVIWW